MLDKPIARIENLSVSFETRDGVVRGVDDLSFEIRLGECLCIVGESGAGKSVSSLALMRLIDFEGGKVSGGRLIFDSPKLGEIDVARADQRTMRDIRGDEICMIFQEPMTALNPVFTVGAQLREGLRRRRGLNRRAAQARALELLNEVRIPEPARRLKQYPHELSGGMRQRVMIAMALALAPRVLIADEPTTALDVTTQAEILALMNRVRRETGAALVFITHDMSVVAQIADRVVVMRDGRKVEDGPVEQMFETPQHDYTKALLSAVPRLGEMRGWPSPRDASAGAMLNVQNLCVRYPVRGGLLRRTMAQVHAVEDVSFTLGKGRTLSLVGESGCGKSSVGRAVLRLTEPAAGRVLLDGQEILGLGPAKLRRARMNMQMVFQDPFASLDPQMRLGAQVAEPLHNYGLLNGSEKQDRVADLFDRVKLPRDLLRRFPHELSGGQRQRAAIARALALNPGLIVADEAVSALDVSIQADVLVLMAELQADLGVSYLFISHDMAVVERISDDVAVMYLGRIVEIGPRAAVFENAQHPYTQALLAAVPVADPRQRQFGYETKFRPVPSPIHPLGYEPGPSVYEEISEGHFVLTSDSGY